MDAAEVMPRVTLGFACPCGHENSMDLARLVEAAAKAGSKSVTIPCVRCRRQIQFPPDKVLNVKPCYEVSGVHLPLSKQWPAHVKPSPQRATVRFDQETIDTWPHAGHHAHGAKKPREKGAGGATEPEKPEKPAEAKPPKSTPPRAEKPKRERTSTPPRPKAEARSERPAPKVRPAAEEEQPVLPTRRWWEFWKWFS